MKANLDNISYDLESREDLIAFLSKANFSYLPVNPMGKFGPEKLLSVGAYIGDIRPYIEILSALTDQLDGVLALNGKELNEQFDGVVSKLTRLQEQFKETEQALITYNKGSVHSGDAGAK